MAACRSLITRGSLWATAHRRRLYDGNYVCEMRRNHPVAAGTLTLHRYCSARRLLVRFSGRPSGYIDEALAALGRERRVVLTVNQFFTAGRVVKEQVATLAPVVKGAGVKL